MPGTPSFGPLLSHWFGTLQAGFADAAHRKRWFGGGPAFDAELRARFSDLVEAALTDALGDWLESTQGLLAYVLVCDQLTRNLFRGRPEAFAGDTRALTAARQAIKQGIDTHLAPDERSFLYMPFEHSEDLLDQHTCVGLFVELRDQCADEHKQQLEEYLRYAIAHRDIIREFGRFPHRNAVLGRESSSSERRYLATGPTFGQSAH